MNNKLTSHRSFWAGLSVIVATIFVGVIAITLCFSPRRLVNIASYGEEGMSVSSGGGMFAMPMTDMDYRGSDDGMMPSFSLSAEKDMYYPTPAPSAGNTAATAEPRIIRTGNLGLEVDSAREKTTKISTIATAKGGFVQSSNVQEDDDGDVSAYVTIRVPEEKFDETMNEIRALASRIETDSTNGQDVTEQYTDLEARLRNAKAQEERYLEILKQANEVDEILAVEQYLSQVRYEIESLEGQLQYLGNQTDYSTISISLFEEARLQVPTAKFDLLRDIKEAARAVILLVQAFLTFLIWFVIIGGAFAIPTALFIYVGYRVTRRIIRK